VSSSRDQVSQSSFEVTSTTSKLLGVSSTLSSPWVFEDAELESEVHFNKRTIISLMRRA